METLYNIRPDIKFDIRPDTGYQKKPDIWSIPRFDPTALVIGLGKAKSKTFPVCESTGTKKNVYKVSHIIII